MIDKLPPEAVIARDIAHRLLFGYPSPNDAEDLARWVLSAMGNVRTNSDLDTLRYDIRISRWTVMNVRDAQGLIDMHAERVRKALSKALGVRPKDKP